MHEQRMFLHRMNLTLVLVLKHEWPHNWPEFISEIVTASTTNEVILNHFFIRTYQTIQIPDVNEFPPPPFPNICSWLFRVLIFCFLY
jgi:hypothetical protein